MSDNKTNVNSVFDAIENVLESFEDAWRESTYPSIREFVLSPVSSESNALLFDLVKIDIDRRYERAFSADCEQETETASTAKTPRLTWYAEQFPELGSIDDWPTDVIAVEYRVRKEFGFNPSFDEYREQFPGRCEELKIAIEAVDRELLEHGKTVISTVHRTTKPKKQDANFGDYEIIEKIGQGGMGVVYKARHRPLNRIVALKTIRADQSEGEALQRFQTECEAAATLQHPGIVPIFESGEVDGRLYYSMPFIDGVDLHQMVTDSSGLTPWEAAGIMRDVADAIQYAHGRGVIHRDLKPRNVLIDSNRNPRVADFGLARLVEREAGLTETGRVMGTYQFMSPEQACGVTRTIDAASDVYSIGATLYFLISRRAPFEGSDPIELRRQILQDEPLSPRTLNRDVNRDLETICLKCLEKVPGRRYESAMAVSVDLQRFLNHEPITARPVSRIERIRRWCLRYPARSLAALAVVVALLSSVGLAVAFCFQKELSATNEKLSTSNRALESVNSKLVAVQSQLKRKNQKMVSVNRELDDALAREKHLRSLREKSLYFQRVTLAYSALRENDVVSALQHLEGCSHKFRGWEWHFVNRQCRTSEKSWRAHADKVRDVAFVNSSKHIVSVGGDGALRVWDAESGKLQKTIVENRINILDLDVSSDGKVLATAARDSKVMLWRISDWSRIATLSDDDEASLVSVSMSGNGSIVAAGTSDGRVLIWSDIKKPTKYVEFTIGTSESDPVRVAFLNNPDHVLCCVKSGKSEIWSVSGQKRIKRIRRGITTVQNIGIQPHGDLVALAAMDGTVKLWNQKSREIETSLNGHEKPVFRVRFSPDGRLLACASGDKTVSLWDVTTWQKLGVIRGHRKRVYSVAFSKDGQRLVTCGSDRTVKLWALSNCLEHRSIDAGVGEVTEILELDGRDEFLTLTTEGELKFWSKATLLPKKARIMAGDHIGAIALSPASTTVATGHTSGLISLWNRESGESIGHLKRHTLSIQALAIDESGRYLVSSGADRKCLVWDLNAKRFIGRLENAGKTPPIVFQLKFGPNAKRVFGACSDRTVTVWSMDTLKELHVLKGHKFPVLTVAVDPTGHRVASGTFGTARIWNLATEKTTAFLNGHGRRTAITGISFVGDGKRIVTGCRDRKLKLWDASTGQEILTFRPRIGELRSVATSDSGNFIYCGGENGIVTIWRALKHKAPPLHASHSKQ